MASAVMFETLILRRLSTERDIRLCTHCTVHKSFTHELRMRVMIRLEGPENVRGVNAVEREARERQKVNEEHHTVNNKNATTHNFFVFFFFFWSLL